MRLLTKLIFIIIGILITAGLSGCKEKEPLPPQMTGQSLGDDSDTISTGYVNEISAADVWIIPDIKENHKTSLWGVASLKDASPEKEYQIKLNKSADDHYLLRMIDKDELYYESGSFMLKDGYSILICEGDNFSEPRLIIYDDLGNETDLTMFRAAL